MSTVWENSHKKPSSHKACTKDSQHDEKKRIEKNLFVYWVWKVQCHLSEIDKLIMFHSKGKKQFSCEQSGKAVIQKLEGVGPVDNRPSTD